MFIWIKVKFDLDNPTLRADVSNFLAKELLIS